MSYSTYADIAQDSDLRVRIVACAAQEGEGRDAPRWAAEHAWQLPGADWVTAWQNAVDAHGHDPEYRPGADPDAVTDQMILSAVQHARTG